MSNEVEEIKARVDIIDLISDYIKLKQAGTNWKALCPFHNEKSPSFMASRDKQIFHCFGCGEGGDIFSFVQKMEGVEFVEALKILAQKAGVKLTQRDPKLASQKNRLLEIIELTTKFWHKTLLESSQAQKARDYLKERQVNERIINDFKLGYAVDSWDTLINFLRDRDYKDEEIFLAGLTVKKDRANDFYDRFRDRLMFPINDLHGNPIGFSGRTLKVDEKAGKYINTPQTLLYNKSLVVFNLDKAKQEIKKQDSAIIVEGQMDVVATFQVGTGNVIATSGTALTTDQINILKRYTNNIAIAFDTDMAGESAAKRGIDLILSQDMNVKVIVLPDGKDPDDCIKKNKSDWFSAIKNAKSIIQYYFDQTLERVDLSSPEGKKEAAKILLTVISKISNKIEQTHWIQKLAEVLKVSERILWESLIPRSLDNSSSVSIKDGKNPVQNRDRNSLLLERILAIVLKYPDNLDYLIDNLSSEIIINTNISSLYKNLIIYYTDDIDNKSKEFDYQDFKNKIKDEKERLLADQLVLLAEKDFFDFDSDAVHQELVKAINFYKGNYYKLQQNKLAEEIERAEKESDQEKVSGLLIKFNEVVSQLNFLNQG